MSGHRCYVVCVVCGQTRAMLCGVCCLVRLGLCYVVCAVCGQTWAMLCSVCCLWSDLGYVMWCVLSVVRLGLCYVVCAVCGQTWAMLCGVRCLWSDLGYVMWCVLSVVRHGLCYVVCAVCGQTWASTTKHLQLDFNFEVHPLCGNVFLCVECSPISSSCRGGHATPHIMYSMQWSLYLSFVLLVCCRLKGG